MPLDFPSSPTHGQIYDNYYYDSPTGAWRLQNSVVNPLPSILKNLTVSSSETTGVSLKVTPFTTSSVNLQEWYNTTPTVVASINVAGDLTANELALTGTEISGDAKTMMRYSDTWLRLNPDGEFTGGVYIPNGVLRTDGQLQIGSSGANFLASSSSLTHNGVGILKTDLRQYYQAGAVGTGTSANYYEMFTWTVTGQYQNFSAVMSANGRGGTDARYMIHARGEYGVSTWAAENLEIWSDHQIPDGDSWLLVFSDANKTAKLYYRRTGNDWNDRSINFAAHWLGTASFAYSNTNFGTVAPTGDAVITKTSGSTVLMNNYRTPVTTEASDTIDITFNTEAGLLTRAAAGTVTFTGANYTAGVTVTCRVVAGAAQRTLAFPAGWVFVGSKPTAIAANKSGILTVTSFGTTEADCIASWVVQL